MPCHDPLGFLQPPRCRLRGVDAVHVEANARMAEAEALDGHIDRIGVPEPRPTRVQTSCKTAQGFSGVSLQT